MQMLAILLTVAGAVIGVVGYFWVVAIAFQHHVGWGIGCLCCGLAQLIFAIQNWDEAGKPFLIMVAGNAMAGIGSTLLENAANGGAGF